MEEAGFQSLSLDLKDEAGYQTRLETSCACHPTSARASEFGTRQGRVYGFSQRWSWNWKYRL